MVKILPKILNFCWPKQCINCGKEGSYLCQNCFALIDISRESPSCKFKYLDHLYFATTYDEKLVRATIHFCKYRYIKELSENLAFFIIAHFKLMDKFTISADIVCCVPLQKSKLKQRGFNQAEEIAKHLSVFLNIPFEADVLLKTKKTLPQMTLSKNKRLKNVINAFEISLQKQELIRGKKILLVDDVLTTGATIEQCAKILKQNCASRVWGAVVARD